MFAVMGGHLHVVHLLLGLPVVKTKPSHINSVSRKDKTALILACERGYQDIVYLLLFHPDIEPKANVHALHNGALRAAARGQHDDCVRLLLRAGADATTLVMNLTHPRDSHYPRMQMLMQNGGGLCGNPLCQHTFWQQMQSPTSPHASTPSNTALNTASNTAWSSAPSSFFTATPAAAAVAAASILPTDNTCIDSTMNSSTKAPQQQQPQPQPQPPQPQSQQQSPLRACSRCHITVYCSLACSKLHWKNHKTRCTPTPPLIRVA